jgi:LytS/YehU family sensor histidine kinase
MALSQMMRYLLYETDKERVTLEKEVSFLMNYIDLEKLRVENATAVHIEVQENLHDILVAPLVFIPFVENSFKHSRIIDDPEAWIEIKLRSEPGKIIFLCSNSIPKTQFKQQSNGGVGLENIEKRLRIIYSTKYKLSITSQPEQFEVELTIKLDEN